MTTFFDLFVRHSSDPSVRDDPKWADQRFRELVASSPFQLWRPGDPISEHGPRYLIGVATWSGYDMRLLDVIAEALRQHPVDLPAVDVFNMADCQQVEDFSLYIPGGLNEVSHTPVMAFWNNGMFYSSSQGHAAREWVAKVLGSTSAEIVAFVQDWITGQTLAL
jgi:hypothetical protein